MPKKLPAGANPGDYVEVKTIEGIFYRKKRGSVKPAKLNDAFKAQAEGNIIASPAAKRIKQKLMPYMNGLQPGRMIARLSGRLRQSLVHTQSIALEALQGYEVQKRHALGAILKVPLETELKGGEFRVTIPIEEETVKQYSPLVTHYYFELVMLYGDVHIDGGLRTESTDSEVFSIRSVRNEPCIMSMVVPEQPWVTFLKVSCIEGNEAAYHPKHYGMKAIGVGR